MVVASAQNHAQGYATHGCIAFTLGVSRSRKMPPATWIVFAPITAAKPTREKGQDELVRPMEAAVVEGRDGDA